MLSFQKLRVYQRSIEFLALALEIIGVGHDAGHEVGGRAGIDLLERIVAMLTKMT